jgi:uroporphyrinogen decarboxylase
VAVNPPDEPARFLRACRRLPVDCTPVWFMRQAGRYLPEYRAIRARYSLLEICAHPDLAAEVTLQPVQKLGVDAAILFADILLPAISMGIDLEFSAGEGPLIHNPIRTLADVEALRQVEIRDELASVFEAIRLIRRELVGRVPLIGFAGAPFTLASYLIEGGASRNYQTTKLMMLHQPRVWKMLMEKLSTILTEYLTAQVEAGVQAVQVFDSWAGALSPEDYRIYVLPYLEPLFSRLKASGIPAIHFATAATALLPLMKEAGGDVIGIDWRVGLAQAWEMLGPDVAIQGNLDPVALMGPLPELEKRVRAILDQAGNRPGHIFNLGHGVLPDTPVENIQAVVELVHTYTQRSK